jgi:hypothetical protein
MAENGFQIFSGTLFFAQLEGFWWVVVDCCFEWFYEGVVIAWLFFALFLVIEVEDFADCVWGDGEGVDCMWLGIRGEWRLYEETFTNYS